MIEVRNLTKRYGNKLAVDNISFTINEGEIVGFLGPNGAGKTTTMNIITGYLSATNGNVKVGGYDILNEPAQARKLIGFLPEIPPLYLDMTVEEYLGFVYELKKCTLNRRKHFEDIYSLVNLENEKKRLIKNLSKGYRQRVGIAQALIGNPEILILDEPTVGLDPNQIIEIRKLIKQLGKKHTVILSSHILPEVQAVCDRVIIINEGNIVADDKREKLSDGLLGRNRVIAHIKAQEKEAVDAFKKLDGVISVRLLGLVEPSVYGYSLEAKQGIDLREPLFELLCERRWPVYELKGGELSLEDIFLKLTSGKVKTERK